MTIRNRLYIVLLLFVVFVVFNFVIFGLTLLSWLLLLLILSFFLCLLFLFRNYISDIFKVKEISEAIKSGNINFTPDFKNPEFVNLNAALNKLRTDYVKLQNESYKVDRMKDDFIYLVSHNLRTPVSSLSGYIDILKDNNNLSLEDKKIVDRISKSASDLNQIIEEILSLIFFQASSQDMTIESINIEELVKNIVDKENHLNNIAIGYSFDSNLKIIKTNKSILETIISNVVSNAVKFNKKDGIISISFYKEDKFYVIKISDTGIGFSNLNEEDLFTPFTRKTDMLNYNYNGIGLGLYISKIGIEKIGGHIKAESTENKGSIFYLYFPYVE
ncbi:MAG: sensor histidine kinase [Patescibacteria group bacterium]